MAAMWIPGCMWGVEEIQVAGVCECENLWGKMGEFCRQSLAPMLAVGFFHGERSWSSLLRR